MIISSNIGDIKSGFFSFTSTFFLTCILLRLAVLHRGSGKKRAGPFPSATSSFISKAYSIRQLLEPSPCIQIPTVRDCGRVFFLSCFSFFTTELDSDGRVIISTQNPNGQVLPGKLNIFSVSLFRRCYPLFRHCSWVFIFIRNMTS